MFSPLQAEDMIRNAQGAESTLISACSVRRQALTRLLEQLGRSLQSLNYQSCNSGGTGLAAHVAARSIPLLGFLLDGSVLMALQNNYSEFSDV